MYSFLIRVFGAREKKGLVGESIWFKWIFIQIIWHSFSFFSFMPLPLCKCMKLQVDNRFANLLVTHGDEYLSIDLWLISISGKLIPNRSINL